MIHPLCLKYTTSSVCFVVYYAICIVTTVTAVWRYRAYSELHIHTNRRIHDPDTISKIHFLPVLRSLARRVPATRNVGRVRHAVHGLYEI